LNSLLFLFRAPAACGVTALFALRGSLLRSLVRGYESGDCFAKQNIPDGNPGHYRNEVLLAEPNILWMFDEGSRDSGKRWLDYSLRS
jgi:hypothetical protein